MTRGLVNPNAPGRLFEDRTIPLRPVARSRNTDPDTSLAAAIEVEEAGVANNQRRAVLSALRAWFERHGANNGPTSAELGQFIAEWRGSDFRNLNLDRYAVARRLPELREGCLIHDAEKRVCRVHHRMARTWRMGPGLAAGEAAEGRRR